MTKEILNLIDTSGIRNENAFPEESFSLINPKKDIVLKHFDFEILAKDIKNIPQYNIYFDKFDKSQHLNYELHITGRKNYVRDQIIEALPDQLLIRNFNILKNSKGVNTTEHIFMTDNKIIHDITFTNKESHRKRITLNIPFKYKFNKKPKNLNSLLIYNELRKAITLKINKKPLFLGIKSNQKINISVNHEKIKNNSYVFLGNIKISFNLHPNIRAKLQLIFTKNHEIFDKEILKKEVYYYDPFNLYHSLLISPSLPLNRLYFWAVRELNNLKLNISKINYIYNIAEYTRKKRTKKSFELTSENIAKIFDLNKDNKEEYKHLLNNINNIIDSKDVYSLIKLLKYLEQQQEHNKIISILEDISSRILYREWRYLDTLYLYAYVIKYIESLFLSKPIQRNKLTLNITLPLAWPYMELHNIVIENKSIDIIANRTSKGYYYRINYYTSSLNPESEPLKVSITPKKNHTLVFHDSFKEIKNQNTKPKIKNIFRTLKSKKQKEFKLEKNSFIELEEINS